MKESIAKKLGEVEEESAARRSTTETFTQISPDVVMVNDNPQQLAALRLLLIQREEKQASAKTVKSKPVTLWRAEIESGLPMSRYLHRVNLYPGKFDSLSFA